MLYKVISFTFNCFVCGPTIMIHNFTNILDYAYFLDLFCSIFFVLHDKLLLEFLIKYTKKIKVEIQFDFQKIKF